MKCGTCQRDIADGSNFCPYCGSTQGAAAPQVQTGGPMGGSGLGMGSSQMPPVSGPVLTGPGGGYTAPAGGVASQRATMSMVLGIASIALGVFGCCCYGFPSLIGGGLGIAAFIMGKNELEDIAGGFASPAGEGQANTGKITGLIGMIVGALFFLGGLAILIIGAAGGFAGNSF